ncbi:hypothetical protein Pf1_00392 [Flavobacterium columnare]|nr:hypothetical protein Pf1_00392 [Flavobacterium columnare]
MIIKKIPFHLREETGDKNNHFSYKLAICTAKSINLLE